MNDHLTIVSEQRLKELVDRDHIAHRYFTKLKQAEFYDTDLYDCAAAAQAYEDCAILQAEYEVRYLND